MKKIIAIILSLVMVLGATAAVYAAEEKARLPAAAHRAARRREALRTANRGTLRQTETHRMTRQMRPVRMRTEQTKTQTAAPLP